MPARVLAEESGSADLLVLGSTAPPWRSGTRPSQEEFLASIAGRLPLVLRYRQNCERCHRGPGERARRGWPGQPGKRSYCDASQMPPAADSAPQERVDTARPKIRSRPQPELPAPARRRALTPGWSRFRRRCRQPARRRRPAIRLPRQSMAGPAKATRQARHPWADPREDAAKLSRSRTATTLCTCRTASTTLRASSSLPTGPVNVTMPSRTVTSQFAGTVPRTPEEQVRDDLAADLLVRAIKDTRHIDPADDPTNSPALVTTGSLFTQRSYISLAASATGRPGRS
jgi:hypothetical protein